MILNLEILYLFCYTMLKGEDYMDFSTTLDFIMNITTTTNSMLAKYVSLDPSFISRLRNGTRKPSKNENYLDPISEFLAKRFQHDYQIECLKNKFSITIDTANITNDTIHTIILNLLSQNSSNNNYLVTNFIKELDQFSFKNENYNQMESYTSPENSKQNIFHGIDGRRQAVLSFLLSIIENSTPQTLLLYSDENMDWLLGDLNYAKKWTELFTKVISLGNRVKIIHTINRSIDDIFDTIKLWMPFYMTGRIEPYYYPNNRDGIFKRTLFIAPESCVLTSTSILTNISNSTSFVIYENNVINSFISEYKDYLKLCKPLMNIFSTSLSKSFTNTLSEFESKSGDAILKSSTLSSLTMPLFVLEKATRNLDEFYRNSFLENHKSRLRNLEHYLKTNVLTEIISLPSYKDINDKNILIPTTSLLGTHNFYYDQFSFKSQLENIISLIKQYKNYHLILIDDRTDDLTIYTKENVGIVIMKYTCPPISFAISESFMTKAFWDYLLLIKSPAEWNKDRKKKTIETLNEYINGLMDS